MFIFSIINTLLILCTALELKKKTFEKVTLWKLLLFSFSFLLGKNVVFTGCFQIESCEVSYKF